MVQMADDLMFTIDRLEDEMNSDQAFRHFEARLKAIGKSLAIYRSDNEVFRKKVERYGKEIEALGDSFWRDWLMKRFKQAVKSMEDAAYDQEDLSQEEDSDL